MYNNIWSWLEIEPTTDKELIRKAYAGQVKKYHPEEHPQEFKELQGAYKQAMKYASGKRSNTVNIFSVPVSAPENQYTHKKDEKSDSVLNFENVKLYEQKKENQNRKHIDTYNYQKIKENKRKEVYIEISKKTLTFQMNQLYGNKNYYKNVYAWRFLFENYKEKDDFHNLDFLKKIIECMQYFVELPRDIHQYINRIIFNGNESPEYDDLKEKLQQIKSSSVTKSSWSSISIDHIQQVLSEQVEINRPKIVENFQSEKITPRRKRIYAQIQLFLKRTYLNEFGSAFVVLLFLFIIIKGGLVLNSKVNNKQPKVTVSKPTVEEPEIDKMFETHGYNISYEMFKGTKDKPYKIDLNDDGYDESIYFDLDARCYKVEIMESDNKNSNYPVEWGDLADYVKQYPDSEQKGEVKQLLEIERLTRTETSQ